MVCENRKPAGLVDTLLRSFTDCVRERGRVWQINSARAKSKGNYLRLIYFFVCFTFLTLASSMPTYAKAPPEKKPTFVVLHSQHVGFPISENISKGIIAAAHEAGYSASDLNIEYLDLVRNPEPAHREQLKRLLANRLKGRRVDIVFAEGAPAFDYLMQEGAALFPDAVMMSNSPVLKNLQQLGKRKLIHFPWSPDYTNTMNYALASFPQTRRVLVIVGGSAGDTPHTTQARADLSKFSDRLNIEFTDALDYEQMMARVAQAEGDTIILFQIYFGDAKGRASIPIEVVKKVADVAQVPVFVTAEPYMRFDVFGGSLLRTEAFGKQAGLIALDYLRGKLPLNAPVTTIMPAHFPMFNWSQMQKWHVASGRLPANSVFIGRPPPLWEQYRTQMIIVIIAFMAMTGLSAALWAQSRRRKLAEQAARASEARFKVLIEAAPEAIFVFDTYSHLIVDANANAVELFGCGRETLLGNRLERFYKEQPANEQVFAESMTECTQRLLAGEVVAQEQVIKRQSDGEEINCDVRLVMLPYAGQHRVRATFTDSTSRKAIESALYFAAQHQSSSASQYDYFMEMLHLLCRLLKFDHVVLVRSDVEKKYELLGAVADGVPLNLTLNQVASFIRDGVAEQQDIQVIASEIRTHFPSNTLLERWLANSCAIVPLWDSMGEKIGFILLTGRQRLPCPERAVSVLQILAVRAAQELEGMRAEETMRHHETELEHQVAARTAELAHANENLARARDVAESATRAKSEFLANMSHEIRTPMNAILGMLYLALRGKLPPVERTQISKAQGAARSLLGIINDILDFSKIEAGKLELERVEFTIDSVLEQLTDAIGFMAEQKGIEFLIRYDPAIPKYLVGDPLRLGQIMLNLCSNAIKFTERGEVELALRCLNASETDISLKISVRDTGIGMTLDAQQKLFEKFSQADQSTTRKFGGTGLGLAICKNLAELMGGQIWIEDSQPGQGTTFCFMLRLPIAQRDQGNVQELASLNGIRVLVIDANAVSCDILNEMLCYFHVEVSTAQDTASALNFLQRAKANPYDLVLMDWHFSDEHGDMLIQCIRSDSSISRQPKIIALIAYGFEKVIHLAEQAGVDGFLFKPLTLSSLLNAILPVLGIRKDSRGEEAQHDHQFNRADIHHLSGMRVLLVDDNELNREFASTLLRSEGIEVDDAENGKIAIDKVNQQHYDAVLMDCQMPVMDGYSATLEIRKNPAFHNLPIIAMTANALAGDREKVIQAGMNDYVSKPFSISQILDALARWISPKVNSDTAPPTPISNNVGSVVSASDTLPPLPGIDVATGLALNLDHVDLYTRMLILFRDSNTDFAEQFIVAQRDTDTSAVVRCAHSLKGMAATIGAVDLQVAAGELEQRLREQAPADVIQMLYEKTAAELSVVMAGLAKLAQPSV